MPRGNKNFGKEYGRENAFNAETAREANKKSQESKARMRPIKLCLKGIATAALYSAPPISKEQKKLVAKMFGIKSTEVTYAHLAIFKQSIELAKGDRDALNTVAAYAGEKPVDRMEAAIESTDFVINITGDSNADD